MNIKFMGKIQVGTIYQKKLVTFVSKAEIDMTQETQQTQLSILVKILQAFSPPKTEHGTCKSTSGKGDSFLENQHFQVSAASLFGGVQFSIPSNIFKL